jgi:hypothetical protein
MDWNIEQSLSYLREHKKPGPAPPYQCAKYVNNALKAGGIKIRPVAVRYQGDGPSACDYGSYLEEVGFEVFYDNVDENLACRSYAPIAGDIAIFMPIRGEKINGIVINMHKHGHIQMYDNANAKWISDFAQHDFFPGRDARVKYDRFRIYRYTNILCKKSTSTVDFSR